MHLVCPSLPGSGFSDKPTSTGWGVERIADAWARLMSTLDYDHYAAQGGDWGSIITATLGARDRLLDNVVLYWLPGTGASSARLYWESYRNLPQPPVHVPTGCSVFPEEINRVPKRWLQRRFTDLRYFSEPDSGGHFASMERPQTFVDELRAFLRTVRPA